MTEDFFLIDIPVFEPEYDTEVKYGWSKYKYNTWDLLKNTTGGYCMYCYDSIWINGQRRGQIEHGIEKTNSPERLTDCVPNLGIACENCNDSYKRRGEVKRKLSRESIEEFECGECLKYDCKSPCEKFKVLRRKYIRNGKIVLQPFEAKCREDGHSLRLQYDLLNCRYIPSRSCREYDREELDIIAGHIKLFELNSPERKNYEIGKFCKNVIDNQCLMQGVTYNSMLVELFREKLRKLELKEAVNVCRIVYMKAFYSKAT